MLFYEFVDKYDAVRMITLLKFFNSKLFNWLLSFFLTGYFAVELLIYQRWGLRCIFWHTHLMFYVYVLILGYWLIKSFFKNKHPVFFRNTLGVFSLAIFSFLIFDFSVIVFNLKIEDRNQYVAPYSSRGESYYHTWKSKNGHSLITSEFSFFRPTNSLGFPDKEWQIKKDSGELRVLCLGDSFTEGDGAHIDSSYVAFLTSTLKEGYMNVNVMNAGVCGSDPFYNYVNLRDTLHKYHPDLVIQTISTNDIETDYATRGGMERFVEKGRPGKVKLRQAPWWEPLYAVSYVARLIFNSAGYNYLLVKDRDRILLMSDAKNDYIKLFSQYNDLAIKYNFNVFLIVLPLREHILTNENRYAYDAHLVPIAEAVKKKSNFHIIDLFEFYPSYMEEKNLDINDVYWIKDTHHNSKGYQMMAKGIYQAIFPLLDSLYSENKIF